MHSKLTRWNLGNKRVFLRADLNVPLNGTTIINDFRLQSIKPTLDYLLKNNAMVILATHIGKPKTYDKNLSTKLLLSWFKKHNYITTFVDTPLQATRQKTVPGTIILLENLRFFPQEQNNDLFFAKELSQTADYYINDAFGALHRNDCSITALPYEFDEHKRSIGLLIEKELQALSSLKNNPKHPYYAILGGKKIEDKIPLIQGLLNSADKILICPALCFTFLAVMGKQVGTSLIDTNSFTICKTIMIQAENQQVELVFPLDYQIKKQSTPEALSYIDAKEFPSDGYGISIGPKTLELFAQKITEAHTIFINCAMGFADNPQTQQSTHSLLKIIAASAAKTIAAGGDTIHMVFKAGVQNKISHLSTGGGAALAYISGQELPGLIPFEE